MLTSLLAQVVALLFETLHLWWYSSDGDGILVLDILGKMAQASSEVTMSVLLLMLANGWTTLYQEIDIDDGAEIYLPIGALVIMIHVVVAALTFVDIDASHKYHDFAGIQGWVLLALKVSIFAYFYWCHSKTRRAIETRSARYF